MVGIITAETDQLARALLLSQLHMTVQLVELIARQTRIEQVLPLDTQTDPALVERRIRHPLQRARLGPSGRPAGI